MKFYLALNEYYIVKYIAVIIGGESICRMQRYSLLEPVLMQGLHFLSYLDHGI